MRRALPLAVVLLAVAAPTVAAAPDLPCAWAVVAMACLHETETGADRCDEGDRTGWSSVYAGVALVGDVRANGWSYCDATAEQRYANANVYVQNVGERVDVWYHDDVDGCHVEATGGPRATGTEWTVRNACVAGPLPDPGWGDLGSHVETRGVDGCWPSEGLPAACASETTGADCADPARREGSTEVYGGFGWTWAEGASTCDGGAIDALAFLGLGFAYVRWSEGAEGCSTIVYAFLLVGGSHKADAGCPAGGPPDLGWGDLLP